MHKFHKLARNLDGSIMMNGAVFDIACAKTHLRVLSASVDKIISCWTKINKLAGRIKNNKRCWCHDCETFYLFEVYVVCGF